MVVSAGAGHLLTLGLPRFGHGRCVASTVNAQNSSDRFLGILADNNRDGDMFAYDRE